MRTCLLALPLLILPLLAAAAQDEKKEQPRYGYGYNATLFPQKTHKEAMASIVKAVDGQRIDYLLAQLADPKFVDTQVADYKALFPNGKDDARTFLAFDKLVNETTQYYLSDPILVKDLRRFAREGEWEVGEDLATGTLKAAPGRKLFLKRIGERWFLENRQK